jgi:hypothetical protein
MPGRHLLVREIEVALGLVRGRFIVRCLIVTAASPFIPFLAVLGILFFPCLRSYANVNTREFLLGIASSATIFLLVFGLPLVCLFAKDETLYFYQQQIETKNVSHIEVYSPLFCYLVLLYLAAYISIVSMDIEHIIDISKRARYDAFKRSTRLISLVPLESKSDNEVTLEQIVHSLESLPGWVCLEEHESQEQGVASPSSSAGPKRVRRKGVSAEGESLIFEAEEAQDSHGLMPGSLDYLTFGVARSTVELSSGGWKIFRRMGFFIQHQVGRCLEWRYQTALLLIFAAFRALIPRLWCTFYFGRSFVPEDPYIATMVWHGFCLTWFIGFAWLAILNNARMAYSECVTQMKLTSALVHLEKRHAYLKSLLDEGTVTEEEFRTLSRKLPYISMDVVDNIKAWWLLREYAIIDTMDERVTLEITMVLVFGLIFLMVGKCIFDFFIGQDELTSFQILCICDMLMLGYIVLKALWIYVEINDIMRSQADILIQARHGILNPQSKLMDMTDEELDHASSKMHLSSLNVKEVGVKIEPTALAASEFLTHLSEVIRVDDYVQTMLDVEVTAFNVAQAILGLITGLGSAAGVLYEFSLKAHQELS